jgi:glyoxylase-like metal-dependent hydrolase (beta-lactamase superfamily II)
MIRKTLVVGPFQCNCSILVCEKTKEAVVIDAGDEFPRIEAALKELDVRVKWSLHTHAHLDHIGAVKELKTVLPTAQIAIHRDDHDMYKQLPLQGRMFGFNYDEPPGVDQFLEDGQAVAFGEHRLTCLHTPGHSPGGLCFRVEAGALAESPFLFSGDTLFRESIGRTDLWGGSLDVLKKSIKQRLYSLEGETQVLPGHGPMTTLEYEAKNNPFVNR